MESPLEDTAVILRGGLMGIPNLQTAIRTALVEDGYPELSFFGENGMSVDEVADSVESLRHAQIMVSSVGRVRSVGFEPFRSPPPDLHLTVRFFAEPSDKDLEALRAAFDMPIPNPSPKG
jgi:hypothetical protein